MKDKSENPVISRVYGGRDKEKSPQIEDFFGRTIDHAEDQTAK